MTEAYLVSIGADDASSSPEQQTLWPSQLFVFVGTTVFQLFFLFVLSIGITTGFSV